MPLPIETALAKSRERERELETRISQIENRIQVLESAIQVSACGAVDITGVSISLNSSTLEAKAATSRFNIINCDTIVATNVVGTNYTPGAGNVM